MKDVIYITQDTLSKFNEMDTFMFYAALIFVDVINDRFIDALLPWLQESEIESLGIIYQNIIDSTEYVRLAERIKIKGRRIVLTLQFQADNSKKRRMDGTVENQIKNMKINDEPPSIVKRVLPYNINQQKNKNKRGGDDDLVKQLENMKIRKRGEDDSLF